MIPLELFLAGISSVMVTISTCAPGIPTVIIKRIGVLLHWGWVALLQRLKQFICRLLTARWHLSTTCQRGGLAVSGKSPQGLTFPSLPSLFFLPFFLLSLPRSRIVRKLLQAHRWQGISWQAELKPPHPPYQFRTTQVTLWLHFCTVPCIIIFLRFKPKRKSTYNKWRYQKSGHSYWEKEW